MNERPSLLRLLVGAAVYKVPFFEARRCLARIDSHGLPLGYRELADHHLAGGRITSLVEGLIYAQARGLQMAVPNAAARDLVAAYTTKVSLTDHLRAFEAAGVRNLDGAPLNAALLKNA
jgi:uncharacterized protein YqfA (UPF0365 family)